MSSFRVVVLGVSTVVVAGFSGLSACSAESGGGDGPPGGTGGALGGTGGAPAMMGGPLSPADAVITGSVVQCPGTMPAPLPDMTVNACVAPGCMQAACVPSSLIQQFAPTTDLTLLGNCGDPSVLCLPIDYIATTGQFQTKTCTSVAGSEGRCISTCVPQVAERIDQLPTAGCAPTERCAPCYDPTKDGLDTKACSQGCDTGPTQPPVDFVDCGAGLGMCVPQELVPANLQSAVPVADCTQPGFVCAPKTNVANINHLFTPCTPSSMLVMSLMIPDGPNGQKGACVPAYLVENQSTPVPMGAVLQDTCATGELCAPCFNPLTNPANQPTGACPAM